MTVSIISPPAMLPVSVNAAKRHLRLEHSAEDALIAELIGAANDYVEAQLRKPLILRTLRQYVDGIPKSRSIALQAWPVRSVESVIGYQSSGDPIIVSNEHFSLQRHSDPALLLFKPTAVLSEFVNGLEIDLVSGLAETDLTIPDAVSHAIKTLVAHWYEFRGAETNAHLGSIPSGIDRLLTPYRRMSL